MSLDLGKEIPDDLFHVLFTEDVSMESGRAIVIVTVDSGGFGHPALLSYKEVGARDRSTIRLVTFAGSNTTKNLRSNGQVTILFIDERMCYYIKGRASEIPSHRTDAPSHFATLDVSIETILAAAPGAGEEGARLTSGITYHMPKRQRSGN